MKGLTYAELHVQNKDGKAETIRIDQGKIKCVGSDSITLTENDDSEVTVAVDDDTDVLGRPGEETALGDLEAGQQVSVSAPAGEAAKAIMVLPKKGDVAGMSTVRRCHRPRASKWDWSSAPAGVPPGNPTAGRRAARRPPARRRGRARD